MSRLSSLCQFFPIAVLCVSTQLLSGCKQSFIPSTGGAPSPVVEPAGGGVLTGALHGGNQPIVGSAVSLYSVGTTGYGSAGTLLATTVSGSTGMFSFTQDPNGTPGPTTPVVSSTYTCPSAGTQLYITAIGGATQSVGNGTNSAAAFAMAIGQCSGASSVYVNLNEVSSVATMAALQQYFNPANLSFGYPSTTQAVQAFANNVALIANMESAAFGAALTSTSHAAVPSGHGTLTGTSVTVTVTPEYNKINLIANILAACVNTTSNTSTSCATLFNNAKAPTAAFTSQPTQSFTTITATNENTLQALYFMLTNPMSAAATSGNTASSATSMSALFGLSTSTPPFAPSYSTAPTDWTVGINYKSSSTCVTQVGTTTTTSTGSFLSGMNNLAIDANGNIWGASSNSSASANLYELSPLGVPLTCGLGTAAGVANSTVIDSAGYVWTDTTTTTGTSPNVAYAIYKWSPTSGALDSTWSAFPYAATNPPLSRALAADGSGNVFVAAGSYQAQTASPQTAFTGFVGEFLGGGVGGATPATITTISSTIPDAPDAMQVDSSGNIWIPITNVGSPAAQYVSEVYPSSGSYATANIVPAGVLTPTGVAIGQSSTGTEIIVTQNSSGHSSQSYNMNYFAPGTSLGTITTPTHTSEYSSGTWAPAGVAVDGASNVWSLGSVSYGGNWVTGNAYSSNKPYGLSELSSTGVNISPTNGANSNSGGFQKDVTLILPDAPNNVAIDPSGNVWVGEAGGTSIMELVGQAVPVVTPLSVATGNSTLGTTP
jgi:sugar lactone lactonase YvrE